MLKSDKNNLLCRTDDFEKIQESNINAIRNIINEHILEMKL